MGSFRVSAEHLLPAAPASLLRHSAPTGRRHPRPPTAAGLFPARPRAVGRPGVARTAAAPRLCRWQAAVLRSRQRLSTVLGLRASRPCPRSAVHTQVDTSVFVCGDRHVDLHVTQITELASLRSQAPCCPAPRPQCPEWPHRRGQPLPRPWNRSDCSCGRVVRAGRRDVAQWQPRCVRWRNCRWPTSIGGVLQRRTRSSPPSPSKPGTEPST